MKNLIFCISAISILLGSVSYAAKPAKHPKGTLELFSCGQLIHQNGSSDSKTTYAVSRLSTTKKVEVRLETEESGKPAVASQPLNSSGFADHAVYTGPSTDLQVIFTKDVMRQLEVSLVRQTNQDYRAKCVPSKNTLKPTTR